MHKKFKMLFLLGITCALAACSSFPEIKQFPTTNEQAKHMYKVQQQEPKQQTSLLVIQSGADQWRWILTDPLGAPLARMLLTPQGWKADGFAPPNEQAKYLFAAITTYLDPSLSLLNYSEIKDDQGWKNYFVDNRLVWKIQVKQNQAQIILFDNSQWLVTYLPQ
ncbi:hypothetical protein [Psittacicella hinzii]|uniref:Lipoprotein n=1 Tax=Psittacicella hinzii TaxID=2028575 RepID=A0A3A1YRB1_9GAMM|nr:hypothetical protein [Psittacicella hinzii]RIY39708.1 hypothetical protein CKF58_01810 [Psittacicella hinzii]